MNWLVSLAHNLCSKFVLFQLILLQYLYCQWTSVSRLNPDWLLRFSGNASGVLFLCLYLTEVFVYVMICLSGHANSVLFLCLPTIYWCLFIHLGDSLMFIHYSVTIIWSVWVAPRITRWQLLCNYLLFIGARRLLFTTY